jgi:hypothetical protein
MEISPMRRFAEALAMTAGTGWAVAIKPGH